MEPALSFAEIYRQHARAVFGLALLLSGNRSDAEDLTSEAFARALASAGPIAQASVRSFLYAIVRHQLASMRRRPAVEVPGPDEIDAHPDEAHGPEQAAWLRQRLALAGDSLAALREPERQVLVLSAVHGLSNPEIADALGLQPGNVRVRLHRARQQLQLHLQRSGHEPA